MTATTIQDSAASWCTASAMPPMKMAGAAISMVKIRTARFWIWATSLVARVTRLGAPKAPTSWEEKDCTLANSSPRSWPPSSMATSAPQYPAAMAVTT